MSVKEQHQTIPIGSIADVRMGVTFRGRDAIRPDPQGSFKLIRISDIDNDGRLLADKPQRFTPEESIRPELHLRPGDVLFPNRGTRNTAHAFIQDEPKVLVGAQFFIIRPNLRRVDPTYLAWFLRSEKSQRHFHERRKGTLVQIIERADITKLHVPLPPLAIQLKIAALDTLASQEQHLLERLNTLKAAHLQYQLIEVACRNTPNQT